MVNHYSWQTAWLWHKECVAINIIKVCLCTY